MLNKLSVPINESSMPRDYSKEFYEYIIELDRSYYEILMAINHYYFNNIFKFKNDLLYQSPSLPIQVNTEVISSSLNKHIFSFCNTLVCIINHIDNNMYYLFNKKKMIINVSSSANQVVNKINLKKPFDIYKPTVTNILIAAKATRNFEDIKTIRNNKEHDKVIFTAYFNCNKEYDYDVDIEVSYVENGLNKTANIKQLLETLPQIIKHIKGVIDVMYKFQCSLNIVNGLIHMPENINVLVLNNGQLESKMCTISYEHNNGKYYIKSNENYHMMAPFDSHNIDLIKIFDSLIPKNGSIFLHDGSENNFIILNNHNDINSITQTNIPIFNKDIT